MIIHKRSVLALAMIAALAGCDDDTAGNNTSDSIYTSSVTSGRTLTNTADVVKIGSETTDDTVTLTIGATSDLHGRLFGYDYALLSNDADAGLTRIGTLINQVRASDADTLLIDIGDTVQGNSASLFNDLPTHPMVSALNTLEYNVWVPGNHEFNFDRSFVDRNLENFDGAVISSNIKWENTEVSYLKPYQIFNIKGVTVAVIAVTPSYVPNWEASAPEHYAELSFEDELTSVTAAVDDAITNYSPDVVIGAFHLGRNDNGSGVYQIASKLADKFDVIFAGHEHAEYIEEVQKDAYSSSYSGEDIATSGSDHGTEDKSASGTYNESTRAANVKIIEPGKWGWALATASIELHKDDDGKWKMTDTTLANLHTYSESDHTSVADQQTLSDEYQWVHEQSLADASAELGTVTGNFTPSSTGHEDEATGEAYDSDAGRLYSTIHYAKVHDTPLMDFINQIQLEKTSADVSAASLFSDHTNLINGETYTKAKSSELYKYDNTLMGIKMTGANLKKFMEWSYSYFNAYTAGDLTVSFRTGAKSYNYDQFDGTIKYTVDLTGDAYSQSKNSDGSYTVTNPGSRVQISEIAGKAFDETATYKVAVNSYRFGTQLKTYGWATSDDVYYESTNEAVYAIRDMLTDYVQTNKGINVDDFDDNMNWSFVQDAAIAAARTDGDKGQALWEKLQNKQICIQIDWDNAKYPGIAVSLNPDNSDSYFANADYVSSGTGTAEACNTNPDE
ncbi:bifunctional metallophosphatase/5'-nucleotidase [Vibrio quintilis]|uniref:Trifunctional nucleotide phosphoesterase protein YfkN n=1 Tax=Vibrio quintilis TaxID=1117707 RepID=A0A1M7YXK8_9VIBR|nr:5'-nucleotidase C-terminal domain-containing protein [Vibrio quintilis]SHO57315.1 Trifunctional nucleotide phosphoesterase protein YfkN precursor [Vibrio quintilis]